MPPRRSSLLAALAALAAASLLAGGCSNTPQNRANYLWSHGFGWHANNNPVVLSAPLVRADDVLLGVARNHRERPYLIEANLAAGTLSVERLERDADPKAAVESRKAAWPGRSFAAVAPRSAELVDILHKLGLDRTYISEPLQETTGSRIGKGVDTKSTSRIDPNSLPGGDSQTLNTN